MSDNIPVLALLFLLSIIDIKKRVIPHWGVGALFLYTFFVLDDYVQSIFYAGSAFLVLLAVYYLSRGGIGGGDVKLITVLAFYLGNDFPLYIVMLALFSGLGFFIGLLWYRRLKFSLPFAPFLFVSMLSMQFPASLL